VLKEFTESAKQLTRNPLGVIGLFIVLVYGLACMVLATSAGSLDSCNKQTLVCFIVLFPCLILIAFYSLVTKHHKKLYAPADFRDERLFFRPLGENEKERRLEEEVSTIESSECAIVGSEEPKQKETQPQATARNRYAEAERLGFLAIEERLGKPIQKYVSVEFGSRSEAFDGLLVDGPTLNLIEIKYFSRPAVKREFLEAVLYRASTFVFRQLFHDKPELKDAVFWFVLVTDFPPEALASFKQKISDLFVRDLFAVEILFFTMDELVAKYGPGSP
jgi:hypothetical protein